MKLCPLFNKQKRLDKDLNLHVQDLFALGQIQLKTMQKMKDVEMQYDD